MSEGPWEAVDCECVWEGWYALARVAVEKECLEAGILLVTNSAR